MKWKPWITSDRWVMLRRQVHAAPFQCSTHPYDLVKKPLDARGVGFIEQLAGVVEFPLHRRELQVGKRHGKTKLAHHRDHRLDDSNSSPATGRDANQCHGLVDVFLQQ